MSPASSSATGSRLYYEVYGSGEPTVFLLPTWSIIHSRHWKMQIPYLARHCRVVTFDGRGNGRSDRPPSPRPTPRPSSPPTRWRCMDATATDRASSSASRWARSGRCCSPPSTRSASQGLVFIGPALPLGKPTPRAQAVASFDEQLECRRGLGRSTTATTGCATTADFLEFFFSQMFTEPHSTKPIEDCVGWGLETTPETLDATDRARQGSTRRRSRELCARIRCPVLVDPRHATTRSGRRPRRRARRG